MKITKGKIIVFSLHIIFALMFIIAFLVYFLVGKSYADLFVIFIALSLIWFFFYLFFKWLRMKKDDIKSEIVTGIIDPCKNDINHWKNRKNNKE